MKRGLFAGSFDPFTVGHARVVSQALDLFDEVVVAAMVNPDKTSFFTEEERLSFIEATYADEPRVKPMLFFGTQAELLDKVQADYLVRGVRNGTDCDYETLSLYATRKFFPAVNAVYFPCDQDLLSVSSTVVRSCFLFDKPFADYIPEKALPLVEAALKRKKG